ncbi:Kelch repeat-containing protein [Archangium lansingense]|uniref:Uncharacterized protein n=2 Tax=Archangium lansingense TaxID=2995310 RepID=A0ABT3ZYS1_9BACT|nr:kelch repeat-containing protein [Archangium lansinium]MCY1074565.1 hypothetical protein [Archangium lansinium]
MLGSGKVLVTGGDGATTAELYDPATDTWSPAGDLGHDTSRSAPVRLYSGEVLLVNGDTQQVDLYNPDTNTWRQVASIPTDRTNAYSHNTFTATRLYLGSVLVVGGSSVDLYDPYNDRWTAAAPVGAPFWGHTATPLYSGQLLSAGGAANPETFMTYFQLYEPLSNTWTPLSDMGTSTFGATSVLLDSGRVMLSGPGVFSTSYSPIFTP